MGYLLGIKFDNLYTFSSAPLACERNLTCDYECIPKEFAFDCEGTKYTAELMPLTYILGEAGQKIAALARYKAQGKTFVVQASVSDGVLSIGKVRPRAYFLNQHLLRGFDTPTVLYFDNPLVALHVQDHFDRMGNSQPSFVVVAPTTRDDNLLPWSRFYGCKVVVFPDFTCVTSSSPCNMKGAAEYLVQHFLRIVKNLSANGADVCIRQGFAVYKTPDISSCINLSEIERNFINATFELETYSNIARIIEDSYCKTVREQEFFKWFRTLAWLDKNTNLAECVSRQLTELETPCSPEHASKFEDVTYRHIIRPKSMTLLIGPKNGGKSTIAWALVRDVLCNKEKIIGYLPKSVDMPSNLDRFCIVDMETDGEDIEQMIRSFGLEQADKSGRIKILAAKSENRRPKWFSTSAPLLDEEFKKNLLKFCLDRKLTTVVFDCLSPLLGNNDPNSKTAQTAVTYCDELAKYGIATIIVAHSKKQKAGFDFDSLSARGNQTVYIRARTVLYILKRDEIRLYDKVLNVVKALLSTPRQESGMLVGVAITVAKASHASEGTIAWLQLPVGTREIKCIDVTDDDSGHSVLGHNVDIDGMNTVNERNIEFSDGHASNEIVSSSENNKYSDDIKTLIGIMLKNNNENGVTNKTIRENTKWSESTVRRVLGKAEANGYIARDGENNQTRYFLTEAGKAL